MRLPRTILITLFALLLCSCGILPGWSKKHKYEYKEPCPTIIYSDCTKRPKSEEMSYFPHLHGIVKKYETWSQIDDSITTYDTYTIELDSCWIDTILVNHEITRETQDTLYYNANFCVSILYSYSMNYQNWNTWDHYKYYALAGNTTYHIKDLYMYKGKDGCDRKHIEEYGYSLLDEDNLDLGYFHKSIRGWGTYDYDLCDSTGVHMDGLFGTIYKVVNIDTVYSCHDIVCDDVIRLFYYSKPKAYPVTHYKDTYYGRGIGLLYEEEGRIEGDQIEKKVIKLVRIAR